MQGRFRILAELGLFALMASGLLVFVGLIGLIGHRSGGQRVSDAVGGAAQSPLAVDARMDAIAGPEVSPTLASGLAPTPEAAMATSPTPVGSAEPEPTTDPRRIGIVAGHWQYDTGAICPDGRREVDVTLDVAQRIQAILEYRGYTVDILAEHDPDLPEPPLQNYRGAALVAVHADSCDIPGASGFKVARWRYSNIPETDDRLVDCIYERYAGATLLPRHDDSITIDMWNYYAFREIAVDTPAAIIELGFLLDDRQVLDEQRYEMALGVADGIGCFLGAPDDG